MDGQAPQARSSMVGVPLAGTLAVGLHRFSSRLWRQAPPLLYPHDGHSGYRSGGACLRHACLPRIVGSLHTFWVTRSI
jgi:hypothetical protein